MFSYSNGYEWARMMLLMAGDRWQRRWAHRWDDLHCVAREGCRNENWWEYKHSKRGAMFRQHVIELPDCSSVRRNAGSVTGADQHQSGVPRTVATLRCVGTVGC